MGDAYIKEKSGLSNFGFLAACLLLISTVEVYSAVTKAILALSLIQYTSLFWALLSHCLVNLGYALVFMIPIGDEDFEGVFLRRNIPLVLSMGGLAALIMNGVKPDEMIASIMGILRIDLSIAITLQMILLTFILTQIRKRRESSQEKSSTE